MPSAKPKAKRAAKPRVPRTRGNGKYTEAAYWAWIRSSLRRMSQRWPPLYSVLNDCKRKVEDSDRAKWGNRIRFVYQCAECKLHYPKKEVEVDHIIPCGSLKCAEDVGPFIERMLCEKDGLRVLCHGCHQTITNEQRTAK